VAAYSTDVYGSWREAQLQKYRDLLPVLRRRLMPGASLLDVGIGKAWLEEFLASEGFEFAKVVGVDADPAMVEPRRPGIEYRITDDFRTEERFDVVVCFDALHLLREPGRLLGYARPGGLVLAAEPLRLAGQLDALGRPADQGVIGSQEKDRFVLVMLPQNAQYRK